MCSRNNGVLVAIVTGVGVGVVGVVVGGVQLISKNYATQRQLLGHAASAVDIVEKVVKVPTIRTVVGGVGAEVKATKGEKVARRRKGRIYCHYGWIRRNVLLVTVVITANSHPRILHQITAAIKRLKNDQQQVAV